MAATRGHGKTRKPAAPAASEPPAISPREARRQMRIDLSREQILDTAEQLFSMRGYHDTGLKEVASLCEFSVGSIYSFFDSKDHLYEAVLMRRGPAQLAEMRRIAADGAPAADRLAAVARLQIEYFRRYPAWGRLVTRALTVGMPQGATLPTAFKDAYRDAIDIEVELFADGQREGVLRDGDPRALARLFSSMVTAFHGMDPEISDDAAALGVEEFIAFVVRAFAAG
jgi:AcrR family transcriptional regulator